MVVRMVILCPGFARHIFFFILATLYRFISKDTLHIPGVSKHLLDLEGWKLPTA